MSRSLSLAQVIRGLRAAWRVQRPGNPHEWPPMGWTGYFPNRASLRRLAAVSREAAMKPKTESNADAPHPHSS